MTQAQYENEMSSHGFEVGLTGGGCTAFCKDLEIGDTKFDIQIANLCETPKVGEWANVRFSMGDGHKFSFQLSNHNAVLLFANTLV